jgi:hypothetical protein
MTSVIDGLSGVGVTLCLSTCRSRFFPFSRAVLLTSRVFQVGKEGTVIDA